MDKKMKIIVLVLSLLAALEPLSIDMYLPAFKDIADNLRVELSEVQLSLSVFLAGFALGQLFWGPLSDRYGRKTPILVAMTLFTVSSLASIYAVNIEQLLVIRFLQAFGGCAGVVIGRAVVNDLFDDRFRTKVFALLTIISGVAPIIAPTIGNLILKQWHWHGIFNTTGLLGAISILSVVFFLPGKKPSVVVPETARQSLSLASLATGYLKVMTNWPFLAYTLIGCMAYGSLMVYVSNAPFLIMEKGGFTGDVFSMIFAVNALGLLLGTYVIDFLLKFTSLKRLVRYTVGVQLLLNALLLGCAVAGSPVVVMLVLVFLNLLPVGLLLPATTSLGLSYFTDESGTASAFMGFLQLAFTGLLSAAVSSLQNDSVVPMMGGIFFCSLMSFGLLSTGKGRRLIAAT